MYKTLLKPNGRVTHHQCACQSVSSSISFLLISSIYRAHPLLRWLLSSRRSSQPHCLIIFSSILQTTFKKFSSIWIVSALCATALSAPTLPFSSDPAALPVEMDVLSEYFQMLGSKVQEGRNMAEAPVCDMNNAVMPVASPTPLPSVSAGLVLKHVAIGRGTQNYSCGTNQTAAPTALGAKATLFNATCVASTFPTLLSMLPNVALQFNLTNPDQATLSPSNLAISGHHYFQNATTPTFNMNTAAMDLGFAPCEKIATEAAPADAPVGQDNKGYGAAPWLKLLTRDGATGDLEEVYRVNTAGGNAPATCSGIASSTFEVQYSAEYWFYES